ncbi:2-amino-4-hydroxy-6-hydroxymethyldihydropteridine diphosphokinase [Candidatus Pelagibacter sp.]|nr:2-amino-4-hydroxy-6-hydroxymethyldihydropteridine diphosphokinase [Candidatus Pelagibacter sp.]
MIKQDISENQANLIYIGIGSNLGNKIINIEKAKFLLNLNGFKIIKTSSYYETLSWPDPTEPKFFNIVILINTDYSPKKMLEIFKKIEIQLGRKKNKKNSPRECDIDIIDYKSQVFKGNIIIPHQKMHVRNFVLFPLFELNKNWIHPILKINIKKLIFSLPIKDIKSIKQI